MEIIFEKHNYSINELDEMLEKYNIDYDKVCSVALILKRSPEMVWLLYKLFCYGITYIPIDPIEPVDKINYILNETQPDLVICDDYKYNYKKEKSNDYTGISYILYTSGSTGAPKGVLIKKEGLLNFIEGVSERIEFKKGKVILSLTTVSFDIFFLESIMSIIKDMTIILANEEEQKNPKAIFRLLCDSKVDMLQITPSRLQMLLNYDDNLICLKNIKELMIGGEILPIRLLKELQAKTKAKIYNMYGPTETTIWTSIADLTNRKHVNIGFPIKNTQMFIVDNDLNVLPNDKQGEICIAGKGLAKGYISKEIENAFVKLRSDGNNLVYKTGDLGKMHSNGEFEYCGRIDNQIKLRGYRIELEQIENLLNQYDGIKQSLVVVLEKDDNSKVLHVFFTSNKNINEAELKQYLKTKVPEYMIPNSFEQISYFVNSINGKIDRNYYKALIKSQNKSSNDMDEGDFSDLQDKIIKIIKRNTDKQDKKIKMNDSFIDLGYDSISFIKVVVAIENELSLEFEDEYLVISKYENIQDMINYVIKKWTREKNK